MRILNIAEKPSVARSISSILCGGNMNKRRGKHKYTMVYEFDYDRKTMVFTSVLGHLYNYEFVKENINYGENENNNINYDENEGCNKYKNIYNMFNAPIGKKVLDSKIVDNIYYNLRNIDKVLIWTDCDREGENIAQEIYDTIMKSNNDKINSRMVIKRIRFSAIEKTHLINAIQSECDINLNEAYAVDARMELDLRIGIIMSRLQSNYFRELNEKSNIGLFEHNNISKDKNKFIMVTYGPCQIPTLNFVVEREDSIINFIEEDFYSLEIKIKKKMENIFKWNRNRVFDKKCITHLYDYLTNFGINENGCNNIVIAKIINVAETIETRFRPLPLRTVELQKICTRLFNVSAFDLMNICEKLYINGYISYPRTETDCFKANFNYKNIVDKIASDKDLGILVDKLKRINGKNSDSTNIKYYARKGKNDDNAHSPIYPLKSGDNLTDKMQRNIYYYIANRFLASISKDAKISKIKVELNMKDEIFTCTGIKILEYNYLEIYKYDKITEKEIDKFTVGEEFPIHKTNHINNIKITEGKTTPPTYLTEPELISLMDKYGIGTDSTIHEHINKIITRKYSIKKTNKIEPLPLGRILIHGYNRINCCYIDNSENNDNKENNGNNDNNTNTILYPLNKPMLRSNLELKLKEIEKGNIIKNRVIEEEIKIYKRIFNIIVNNLYKFKEEVEDNNNYVTTIKNNNKRNNNNNRGGNNSNIDNNNNNRSSDNNNSNRGNNNRNRICNVNNNRITTNTNANSNNHNNHNNNTYNSNNTNHTNNNNNNITDSNDNKIICKCNIECKLSIVNKNNENKGKYFYSCKNYPDGCDYFMWKDTNNNTDNINNRYNSNNNNTGNRYNSNNNHTNTNITGNRYNNHINTTNNRRYVNNDSIDEDIKCNCGYTPKLLISKTEKNNGREFYKCNREYKPCNYFQWK